jgi:hypothetical protein
MFYQAISDHPGRGITITTPFSTDVDSTARAWLSLGPINNDDTPDDILSAVASKVSQSLTVSSVNPAVAS